MTDVWDKRAISSILKKYFDPLLMEDGYMFSDGAEYFAPPPGSIEVRCAIFKVEMLKSYHNLLHV